MNIDDDAAELDNSVHLDACSDMKRLHFLLNMPSFVFTEGSAIVHSMQWHSSVSPMSQTQAAACIMHISVQ